MNYNDLLSYDSDTGELRWKVKRNNKVPAGTIAGYVRNTDGYRSVKIFDKYLMEHRVIWDMMHPEDPLCPGEEIDHVDHNKQNNRVSNLRKVSGAENKKNRPRHKDNTSGITGVCWYKRYGLWRVQISVENKPKHIGYFAELEDAVIAYEAAKYKYGFHKNHGA